MKASLQTMCFVLLLMSFLSGVSPWSICNDLIAEDKPIPNTGEVANSAKSPTQNRDATITLEFDKPTYFLGENVILHWHFVNSGNQPINISMGGDGRTPGANRAIRFKVDVIDEKGLSAADPYPNPNNFGGMFGNPTLEPGEEYWDELQLMRYREVKKSGKYTIKVYHNLGWKKPDEAPVVTTTLHFVMPNENQAREVFDEMLSLPDNSDRSWGKKGRKFADFELMRYPVYLPMAKELAQQGDIRGLKMLGEMAFPDATTALLELMSHNSPAISEKAGELLLRRMSPHEDSTISHASYLASKSWTDELRKLAAVPAWKLLAEDDREGIIRGARLIRSLGIKDDLPALIKVMDRVLIDLKGNEIEQQAYPRPWTASSSLAGASQELLQRGARSPESATTPGNSVVWLLALGTNKEFRPEGWRETIRGLVQHEIPFIRDLALRNMPLPLDSETISVVEDAILDGFTPVQAAACDLAGKSNRKEFGPNLITILRLSENDWLIRAAFRSAHECGVPNDKRLEICLQRMGRFTNDRNMVILGLLIDGSIDSNGHGAQEIKDWKPFLPGIQTAWLNFIEAHRQELQEGTRYRPGSESLSPDMFPPQFQLHINGQPGWPIE